MASQAAALDVVEVRSVLDTEGAAVVLHRTSVYDDLVGRLRGVLFPESAGAATPQPVQLLDPSGREVTAANCGAVMNEHDTLFYAVSAGATPFALGGKSLKLKIDITPSIAVRSCCYYRRYRYRYRYYSY